MPSRRRTSRAAPPIRQFYRTKTSLRLKHKPKAITKPRLVRRYKHKIHEDSVLDTRSGQAKQLDPHLTFNLVDKKSKNISKKISTHEAHNAVADVQTSSLPRSIAAEITSVPNPVPDSGATFTTSSAMMSLSSTSTDTVGAGYPLLGAISSTTAFTSSGLPVNAALTPTLTSVTLKSVSTASFSALPPLLSKISTSTITEYTHAYFPSDTSTPTPSPNPSNSGSSRAAVLKAHEMTVVIAILLAVGSALLLVGAYVSFKICTRAKRYPRPTPSLPILKDDEDDFFEAKESPIFGGDSRMSSATGHNGAIWTWVQYPQTKPTVQAFTPEHKTCPSTATTDPHYATQYPLPQQTQPTNLAQTNDNYVRRQSIRNATTGPHKRLSMRHDVFYDPPNSNIVTNNGLEETSYIVEGPDTMKRKPKAAIRRSRQFVERNRYRNSTNSFMGLAYDADVTSAPGEYDYIKPQETPTPESKTEGRAKVKSGYFAAGTYPRMSTLPSAAYSIATATRINVGPRNSFSRDGLSIQRSNSKRARDTQALTYALGLASPKTDYGAPSPLPSPYPDEPVFEVQPEAAKRPKRRNPSDRKPVESIPDIPVIMPMLDAGESADDLTSMALGTSRTSFEGMDKDAGHMPERNTDKPPRVPSPPSLPSLAQMAMEHQEEILDGSARQRGPTYIYGLYEGPDRSFVR